MTSLASQLMKKLQLGCGKKGTAEFGLIMKVGDKNRYGELKGIDPLEETS